jgi:hypothetical protein
VVAAAPAAPADDHDQAPAQQLEKSDDGPTPGREEAYQPLGRPAPLASTSDSYAFVGGGRPGQAMVAYSPCRPIHYVVRPDNAPPGGQQIIAESVAAVSRATGLKFVFDGPTAEGPSAERDAFQPGLYGDRWAPVLVSWTTEQESPQLVSGSSGEGRLKTLGLAGSTAVAYGEDPYVYVSGQVKLNAPALAEGEGQSGPGFISSVVAHELAHVVGLEHVDDPTQLMYPQAGPERLVFAAGDLTGLAKLGRGPCAPNV